MRRDYYIANQKPEIDLTRVSSRLAVVAGLLATQTKEKHDSQTDRNLWTRTLDSAMTFMRRHARPVHWLGFTLTALIFYVYARIVALTARLVTSGDASWPDVRAPAVVALWHGDAPSLVAAFAKRRPKAPAVILIGSNPRGDCLALLCRMLGFDVVRKSGRHGDWTALAELAKKLKQGAFVIITADGDGPAKVAKVGALALASATGVPLVPLVADCHPALQQSNKWDVARNPVPFCSLSVWIGPSRTFAPFADRESIECALTWLQKTLNETRRGAKDSHLVCS
jgi:lysophospholipid acyltransferase (LPLAT)-like uncharacterized protein